MKSSKLGKNTLALEVQNVSPHGIWMLIGSKEFFLDYDQFPWFRDAKLSEIFNVELHYGDHLFWPDLDVDLEIDSLENPAKYPLVAKK